MKQKSTLTKRFHFNGAHKMYNDALSAKNNAQLFGLCQNIHGHNYTLDVSVDGTINSKTQCIVNLEMLKNIVNKEIILVLDHQYLNEVLSKIAKIKGLPITLENLSSWIWKVLCKELKKEKINLSNIRLWESDNLNVAISKK